MKNTDLLTNIVAVAVLGYCGYSLTSYDDLPILDAGKYALGTVAGLGWLGYANFSNFMSLFAKNSKTHVFTPEEFEKKDFDCLVHLRNRVTEANSQDGVKACQELNNIVFGLHAKEKSANEVPTNPVR